MPPFYDPHAPPDPAAWLALDEGARIRQVEKYHQKSGIRLPNVRAHATFHAIVENQIAEGLPAVVRAMARLTAQGLSRHDAVHAICWVLAQHLHGRMNTATPDEPDAANARYAAEVDRLNAQDWLAAIGD